jgi:repressor LexA
LRRCTSSWQMRFDDWLIETGKSAEIVAGEILLKVGRRMSGSTVWKIALGRHKPSTENAAAIVNVTDGKVSLDDLAAGPNDPSRLRRRSMKRGAASLPVAADSSSPPPFLPPGRDVSEPMRVRADGEGLVELPLLGYVAAGVPIKAQPSLEGTVAVERTWVGSHTCFALRVTGDSMLGAGILPHDIVIVRQANTAFDGDIVVVTVDGETTLKRYRDKDGRVLLVPENPTMAAIQLKGRNVLVQGVVVGQMRSYHRSDEAAKRMGAKKRRG